jgi:hypothetical protein
MHNRSRPHHTTFMDRRFLCCCFLTCFLSVLVLLALKAFASGICAGSILPESPLLHKKINFVFKDNRRTVNPAGWEEYDGSIYRPGGWRDWWGFEHQYAQSWYQKLMRVVDPGFHSLRLNSLAIEQIGAPTERPSLIFRDFFNRDDSPDVNAGIVEAEQWAKVKLHPNLPGDIRAELSNTSIKLTGPQSGAAVIGLVQPTLSPAEGVIRYSTRVSLFTGEGSQIHSGAQEAGMIILADPLRPTEFNSTFVGVGFDSSHPEALGWLIYRVGDGKEGYRTNLAIPDAALPFKITEGEFEVILEHDVAANILRQIRVNGVDVTDQWALQDRRQHLWQGRFGIRSTMNSTLSKVRLRQFYWYYRVEKL